MRTFVVSGENIANTITKFQSNIKKSWCACVNSSIPAFSMSSTIKGGYSEAKKRGVRIRYVTEITRENILHCNELMEFAEMRHLAGVHGSFAVSEAEFVAGISSDGNLEKLVYSDVPELVAHQQEVFETLWHVARPADERIRDLN